jgi:hypothetical protein
MNFLKSVIDLCHVTTAWSSITTHALFSRLWNRLMNLLDSITALFNCLIPEVLLIGLHALLARLWTCEVSLILSRLLVILKLLDPQCSFEYHSRFCSFRLRNRLLMTYSRFYHCSLLLLFSNSLTLDILLIMFLFIFGRRCLVYDLFLHSATDPYNCLVLNVLLEY